MNKCASQGQLKYSKYDNTKGFFMSYRYWETIWYKGRTPGLVKFQLVPFLDPKGLKQE